MSLQSVQLFLVASVVLVMAVASIEAGVVASHQDLPTNSKFLNPQLDEDTNLQSLAEDYEEGNTTDPTESEEDESLFRRAAVANKEEGRADQKQTKLFGLLSIARPMFGSGLGYGGLYGSQYYGLGRPQAAGMFPFYNMPYYTHYRTFKSSDSSKERKKV